MHSCSSSLSPFPHNNHFTFCLISIDVIAVYGTFNFSKYFHDLSLWGRKKNAITCKIWESSERFTDFPRLETRFLKIQLGIFSRDPPLPPYCKWFKSYKFICSFLCSVKCTWYLVFFCLVLDCKEPLTLKVCMWKHRFLQVDIKLLLSFCYVYNYIEN